jgi:hypothetical protein
MGWVIGAAALFGVGLLWWFLRSDRDGDEVSSLDDDGRTRLAKDGFFVRGVAAGTRVRWKARVNGTWRTGTADMTGDETFVYTGATPTDVEIQVAGSAPVVSAPVSSSPPSSNDDDDGPFVGIPSEY